MGATAARQARVSNPVFARIFPRLSQAMEAGGIATRRKGMLAGLTGQVIDIGAGTWASFGHYPAPGDCRRAAVRNRQSAGRAARLSCRTGPAGGYGDRKRRAFPA